MAGKLAYMELSLGDVEIINALLPARYKIELNGKKEFLLTKLNEKRPESRKTLSDAAFHQQAPEKRPTRERKSVAYEEIDSGYKSSEGFKKLFKILQNIKKHPLSDPFLNSVGPHDYPDYYKKIDRPMDLTKVETKLKTGQYESGYDFAMDIRLIWKNSFTYNEKGSDIYNHTAELSGMFENFMRGNEFLTLGDKKNIIQDMYRKIEKLTKGIKDLQNKETTIKPQTKSDKPMSFLEKKSLCQSIKNLDPKYLKGVLDIVKECMDIQGEELEFDIDKLPPKVCRELDVYVKNCSQNSGGKKKLGLTVEPIKPVTEVSSSQLNELDSQLHKLVEIARNEPVHLTNATQEGGESDSSSSSDSDEDQAFNDKEEAWKAFPIDDVSDTNGFGMMDFDKYY
ncbi:hypothetical protein SteCoe_15294 [Stentor coeruleus]|uniref:Bromo domain-containing protein n=1 Tax=Stentor coeruleus TaxID=5963 RepID=A0A1R2C3Y5_9CILI|nr:hypothetical protein SteCoe_15294 [Stentor coeruleus]